MKAIIIDDSEFVRNVLGKMLDELGCKTVKAGDGQEALEKLKQTGPLDLALVDWHMPTLNGIEFVRLIRENPAFEKMQIMMVTTQNEMDHVNQARAAGVNEYVMKPFTKEIILAKLQLLGFPLESGL